MIIELKQAAQDAAEAIDWLLKNIRLDAPQLYGKAMGNAEKCASALRIALSQQPNNTSCKSVQKRLAAQHPATTEPVVSRNPFASRCYTMSESHLSGHRLIVGFEKLGDAQDAYEWVVRQGRGDFTHPEPGVPADVMRDAERGRFLIEWLKRRGLLQAEFGQMGVGEKPENWWLLHAPWGIDKTRPFFGHGKTPEQAIDAAMLAAKAQKGQG